MTRAEDIPATRGAYVLLLELRKAVAVTVSGQTTTLNPGEYVYCGSANGPGGLKARIRRHLKKNKSVHWHIDQLTGAASTRIETVMVTPGGRECTLLQSFLEQRNVDIPVPRFGSSDCRHCPAHLLRLLDKEPALDGIAAAHAGYLV